MKKLNEFFYKYDWQIISFLLILFLAILVNSYIIQDRKISADNAPIIEENNQTYIDDNLFKKNLIKQIQNSIDSGNLIEIFWKIIYFGPGLDRLCYYNTNTKGVSIMIIDVSGNQYTLIDKYCFNATEPLPKIGGYKININISHLNQSRQVSKNECIDYIQENCYSYIMNGKGGVSCFGSCITNWSIQNAISEEFSLKFPEKYFEANFNILSQMMKFIFVFLLTGILCWNVTRIWVLIRDGWVRKERK